MGGTKRMAGVDAVHNRLRKVKGLVEKILREHPQLIEEYREEANAVYVGWVKTTRQDSEKK